MRVPTVHPLTSAGLGRRLVAYLIDGIPVGLVLSILGQVVMPAMVEAGSDKMQTVLTFQALMAAIYVAYFGALPNAFDGRTPGQKAMGIWVATADGSIPGPGRLLLRGAVKLIVVGCFPIALFSAVLANRPLPRFEGIRDDADKVTRFPHDWLAGTYTLVESKA